MKCNLATWDRIIRFILGFLMITFAVAGGPWWCYLGLYLMATSSWGFCPLAVAAGFSTAKGAPSLRNNEEE